MKRIALILTGLHYREQIDFRFYIKNIKDYIYPLGEIDVLLFTNHSSIEQDLQVYSPKHIEFMEDTPNRRISKTMKALEQTYDNYDFICITRFDIYFLKELNLSLMDVTKINIMSTLLKTDIDDNFYFFPVSLLPCIKQAYSTINKDDFCGAHYIKSLINPSYIYNESLNVCELSSFKLRFFPKPFIMNYKYTENIPYIYNKSELVISNSASGNIVHFKKRAGHYFSYFAYNMNIGTYNITYSLKSNIPISNFIQIDKLPQRYKNRIDISKPCLVYFIFDKYMEELDLLFTNIQITRYSKIGLLYA